jgi:oligopeptide/dipeptide ABC transporter ATP-binding protein
MARGFLRFPSGIVGIVCVLFLLIAALLGPPLLGLRAAAVDVLQGSQNPSLEHLLGTDALGRDILFRLIVATRLTLGVALSTAALAAAIGLPAGAAAAVLPGRLRSVALRVIDSLLAFPPIVVAIFVAAIVGSGPVGASLGVGLAISFSFARLASSLAMSIGGRDYVIAGRALGVSPIRLLFRYVLPNVAETLAITSTVAISSSIVAVSSLSFLGLGVQAPDFDWGRMLTDGVQAFYSTPAAALGPAAAIATSALAFGFAGEGLARSMNPMLWTGKLKASQSSSENDARMFAATPERLVAPAGNGGRSALNGTALEVSDLTVTFPGPDGGYRIVDSVSFSLAKGQMLGIVGESGSGKTMTALAIAQLVPPSGEVSGTVTLAGKPITAMRGVELNAFLGTHLAMVFQDPMSSLNPALRIGTQLTEGAEVHRRLDHRGAISVAVQRLHEVNLPTPERQLARHPHELSGGMRQRVMIAMGLMNEPHVLIADEPTTALDVTIQAQIMDVLEKVNRERQTAVLLISHNIGLISQNCQRVLVMYAGTIVEEGATDDIIQNPLHPYTRALLAAVPDMTRAVDVPLASIPGQAPDPATLPSGCPYHPRCPLAVEICKAQRPVLVSRPQGRRTACWVANRDLD